MKIFTVVGARPQFIKAAVVSRAIEACHETQEVLVHTGQHFDNNMSNVFFQEMEIPKPSYHLNINTMTHGKMTGKMMEELEDLMLKEKPDVVLVYGDTNSTLAGALAASKLHIPIAHVEAGLRSFNMEMPEEVNRILTDRISQWLFCPTEKAVDNLKKEGYENFDVNINNVGDVMYDAALFYKQKLNDTSTRLNKLENGQFVLATLHRQENTQDIQRLRELIQGLNYIHKEFLPVIMPLHPGTAQKIKNYGLKVDFQTIAPVGYFDMIRLLENCKFVMTDSGGLQKEACFFGKYCLTMRDQTEWVELVENKVNYIIGADQAQMISTIQNLDYQVFPSELELYGNGHAGDKILDLLIS